MPDSCQNDAKHFRIKYNYGKCLQSMKVDEMSNRETLSELFIEQVKEALENLYDFQTLQDSALTQQLNTADDHRSGAHQLRSQLIHAIETLNPGQDVAAHSGTVRIYNLIYMHYVGRLTIQQAAWEVGVSLRQAYRDIRRGQELLSAMLWHTFNTENTPPHVTSVKAELTRLEDTTGITTLQELVENAMRPIQILADKFQVAIEVVTEAMPIMLTTNPIIAQQVLTHILSQIIQQVRPSNLCVQLGDDQYLLRMTCADSSANSLHIKPIIQQMMDQLSWELQYIPADKTQEIRLQTVQRSALLVLIDDNEGLSNLLQRYLTDTAYTIVAVPNTEEGVDIIQQMQPDGIILDVMMPGIDGWELLQRLRTNRETACIPVIICSVINDPELAFALGAAQYMPKPVTREALLHALHELSN